MAVPTITALPAVPSRIGDPTNFFAENLAFLSAQADFADECNDIADYLNDAIFNPFDWGNLTAISGGGSPVSIANYPNVPPTNPPLTGLALTSAIDDLLQSLSDFVSDGNTVASYIDDFTDPLGTPVSDPERPIVHGVDASPTRADQPSAFNTNAAAFYGSARAFALSLQEMADYATSYLESSEDWSLITSAITETDDWGSITS